jgi:hypothetical protein
MLGIVAVLGAHSLPPAPQADTAPVNAAVVLRAPAAQHPAARRVPPTTRGPAKGGASSTAGRAPDTTTGPS